MACPKIFKLAAKRKVTTIIPMVLLFIISIIIMVLSVQQSKPINEPLDEYSEYQTYETYFENWEDKVCGNTLIYFLSPFAFDLVIKYDDWDGTTYSEGIGIMSCPWRERNTIFRLTIDCLVIVATISIFVILITEKGKDIWPVLTWIHWILFLLMFVVFILDCDGIYTGFNSCQKEFDIDEDEPVIMKLLEDAAYESASNSGTYSSWAWFIYGPSDFTDDSTFDCMVTPFLYTALSDLAAVIFGFAVWRIGRFYKFDNDDDDDIDLSSINNKTEGTGSTLAANDKNSEMATFAPNSSTPDNLNSDKIISPPSGSTNQPKKEDSDDPFAEFNPIQNNAFDNNNAYDDGTANQQQTVDGNNTADNYVNPFDD